MSSERCERRVARARGADDGVVDVVGVVRILR
jgi:hypothetical protein